MRTALAALILLGGLAIATPVLGQSATPPTLWETLVEDVCTYGHDIGEVGLWVTAAHRVRVASERSGPPALRPFVRAAAALVRVTADWIFGVQLPPEVELGRRVRIWHHGGMVLHAERIGDDVHVRQNTTFGIARKEKLYELPVIEDRVDIGCGAAILGGVTVGHDSVIGANAVVVKDVPPNSVAVGVPARIVRTLFEGGSLQ